MNRFIAGWRFVIELYLGNHGFRTSMIAYAVGFWVFAVGAVLWVVETDPATGEGVGIVTSVLLNLGLLIVVFLTYPVVLCGYRKNDHTRFRSSFLRMFVPAVIGLISPIYLMLLVVSFIRFIAGPVFYGVG